MMLQSEQQSVKIVPVCPADFEGLAIFLEREIPDALTTDEWRKKFNVFWEENPAFDADCHSRGWILKDDAGSIFGFLGSVPVAYIHNGKQENAYSATTWIVIEKARWLSLKLFQKFLAQDGVLFATTPTPAAEMIYATAFRFSKIDSGWIANDYMWPVNPDACARYVRWRFRRKKWSRPLAPAVGVIVKLVTYLLYRRLPQSTSDVHVSEIPASAADIDVWWAEFKERATFTQVRNARVMRWLYQSGSFTDSRRLLQVRKGSRLLGFVGLKLNQQPTWAFTELVDFALLDMSDEVLRVVILELQRVVRLWSENIAYLRVYAFNEAMGKFLVRAGFWKFDGRSRFYFLDKRRRLSRENLHFTPVDGDRPLFP